MKSTKKTSRKATKGERTSSSSLSITRSERLERLETLTKTLGLPELSSREKLEKLAEFVGATVHSMGKSTIPSEVRDIDSIFGRFQRLSPVGRAFVRAQILQGDRE